MPSATEAEAKIAVTKRSAASEPMLQANAQPMHAAPESAMARVTTRSLPKRSPSGPCTRTAPARGPKGALAMASPGFLHGGLQRGAVRHALALRRGPGGEAGAQRPGRKVRVRFLGAQLLDAALDADLPLQVRPEEHQARGGARVQLAPLAAAVVRVEGEAAALDAFQEHRPSGGCARF